jgi:trk system potassium uptake protein TrkA
MNITIVGAGKSGTFLADRLWRSHDVTAVDQRPDRAERLRTRLPSVHIVRGDAAEPEVLKLAVNSLTDLVVAVTGDDEDNLVVAMLSKHLGAKSVFARVNHPENEWLFTKEWGVDIAVSSASILYNLVEKEVGIGDLITLIGLQAEGVSIEEVTLPDAAHAVGQRIADINMPEETQIAAIITSDKGVVIPRGDTVLAPGDELLLLSTRSQRGAVLEALGIE